MKRIIQMNRFFAIILMIVIALNCLSQVRWDSENCRYVDYDNSFHWMLDSELEWKKVMPAAKHTVFAAQSPYGLYAFVRITPLDKEIPDLDIWRYYDKLKQSFDDVYQEIKKRTGIEITLLSLEKCMFWGNKAIKKMEKSTPLNDDVNDGVLYMMSYMFYRDNASWSVCVECPSDIYEIVGEEGFKELFKGFGFNLRTEPTDIASSKKQNSEIEESLINYCKQMNQLLPLAVDDLTTWQFVTYSNWTISSLYNVNLDSNLLTEAERNEIMDNMKMEFTKEIPKIISQGVRGFTIKEFYEQMKQTGLRIRHVYHDINGKTFGVIQYDYRDFENN